jgi:hypothetical protein
LRDLPPVVKNHPFTTAPETVKRIKECALWHPNKKPEGAVAVLHNEALPFYEKHGNTLENILTDNGTEFKGTDLHPS